MKSYNLLRVLIIFTTLGLTSCGLQGNATPSSVSATPGNTSIKVTETSSTVDQPTKTSTQTPIPTLPSEVAFETFVNLIEKDGDCNLPCWLGIIPGQTIFDDVVNSFSKFSSIAYTEFSSERAFIRVFFPNFEIAIHDTTTVVIPTGDGKVAQILVYAGVDPKAHGNITYSNSEYQKIWQRYFVSGIFERHGPPEKIFLDTTRLTVDPATSYPFALWIVYPQQGFLIRYDGNNIKTGENIRICPIVSRIEMTIWDVKKSNYEEFMKNNEAGGISLGPQSIEKVTDFNNASFYETFKKGELDTCFETPASFWPK